LQPAEIAPNCGLVATNSRPRPAATRPQCRSAFRRRWVSDRAPLRPRFSLQRSSLMRSRRFAPRYTSVSRRSSATLVSLLMLGVPQLASAQPEEPTDATPAEAAEPTPGSSMDAEGADPVAS